MRRTSCPPPPILDHQYLMHTSNKELLVIPSWSSFHFHRSCYSIVLESRDEESGENLILCTVDGTNTWNWQVMGLQLVRILLLMLTLTHNLSNPVNDTLLVWLSIEVVLCIFIKMRHNVWRTETVWRWWVDGSCIRKFVVRYLFCEIYHIVIPVRCQSYVCNGYVYSILTTELINRYLP